MSKIQHYVIDTPRVIVETQPLTQPEIERIAVQNIGVYSRTEILLAQYVLELQASLMAKEAAT